MRPPSLALYRAWSAKFTAFSLDEQLRRTVLLLEPRWSSKNIELDVMLDSINFVGDEELMSHVWYNILDNAVKFTHDGGTVTIRAIATPEYIHVAISDKAQFANVDGEKSADK